MSTISRADWVSSSMVAGLVVVTCRSSSHPSLGLGAPPVKCGMLGDKLMRHHRAAARLLTLLPLVALLAGCGSTGESRTVQIAERPSWTVGDSWTYRGKGRDGAYTITRRVLREGVFEGHDAYEVEAGDSRYWYTKRLGYLARVTATGRCGGPCRPRTGSGRSRSAGRGRPP